MLALMCNLCWYLPLVVVVLYIVAMLRSDCDLLLLWCSKWGKKPQKVLNDKIVWVTGASSGIGEHLCYSLAKCGSVLILSARREEELKRVLERCKELSPSKTKEKHKVLPMDLMKTDKHEEIVENVLQQFGRVDVLVNNAGQSQRSEAIRTKREVDKFLMELNYLSTVSLTKAVLPSMVEQGGGSLVIVSSVAGKIPAPGSASYSASKHALQGFFDTLRIELSDKNISILSVCPGPVNTPFLNKVLTEDMTMPTDRDRSAPGQNRVTAERCAELMTIAMANNLNEVWISLQPILLFTYISQYLPLPAKWLGNRVGMKRLKAIKRGELDIDGSLSALN